MLKRIYSTKDSDGFIMYYEDLYDALDGRDACEVSVYEFKGNKRVERHVSYRLKDIPKRKSSSPE